MPSLVLYRILPVAFFCIILASISSAQEPSIRTFYDSRAAVKANSTPEEPDGESARFERWEYRMTPRLLKGGAFPGPGILRSELKNYYGARSGKNQAPLAAGGNWRPLGPMNFDAPGANNGGTGRVNVMRFHPNDTTTIFVGTPDGGLWKTTDEGLSWTPLTDDIPSLGVTDIAIDPKNPNTIYIATGDARAAAMYGNPYTYGILKSTDGGDSWSPSGLSFDLSERILVQRVVVSPQNSNVLLAGVYGGDDRGIQKSTDGGATWSKKDGGSIYDIVYNPADPTLVYASGYGNFRRSTNGGDTWTGINGELPTWTEDGVSRTMIAVTPADPNVVYVVYVSHSENQIFGLYRSTDKGLTFTQVLDTTKYLRFGNYGEYNLILCVSPVDANTVILGEQLLARSTDGGATWKPITTGIHVDNHAFLFAPRSNTVCYSGNDGGFYRSTNTGSKWTDLSAGLNITQYYRLGSAMQRSALLLSGAQDNGVHRYETGIWSHEQSGADGAECLVDYSDESIIYYEFQNGWMTRRDEEGYWPIAPDNNGHWITPLIIHPTRPQTIYTAFRNIWRSDNRGNAWEKISPMLANNDNIKSLALAPSDDQTIYAGTYIKVFRTTDGGDSWKDITAGSPSGDTAALTYICVSPTDPKKVWLTFSGFTAGKHVYRSTDGGDTWTNITGSLPNVPVNTVVYAKGSNDAVYIGTDVGVFFRDKSMIDWEPFMTGLPNVSVSELEIHEPSGVIRAATFGRGVWESPLRSLVPPRAPALLSPANDSTDLPKEPFFIWQKVERTSNLRFQLAEDSLFENMVWNVVRLEPDSSMPSVSLLGSGKQYFWRVAYVNAAGQGPWSETWSFTTAPEGSVEQVDAPGLRVYPNPSSMKLTVVSNELLDNIKLVVVDRRGIARSPHTSYVGSMIEVDINDLPSGIYFLRIAAKNFVRAIPFVVEK